ncbi:MAG: thioredoxin family protein [Fibrobacteria bacterium]|nr:thioredoxin family protein [Fibrobacteria bacterium]
MRKILVFIFLSLVLPVQAMEDMRPPAMSFSLIPAQFSEQDTLSLQVHISLQEGWHINSVKPENKYAIPTKLVLTGAGLGFDLLQFPKPLKKEVKVMGGVMSLYEGAFLVKTRVWRTSPSADVTQLIATLHYQACSDVLCLRPDSVMVTYQGNETSPTKADTSIFIDAGGVATSNSEDVLNRFDGPLILVILFLIGGGLLLNLTPCVYPLIAITISLFGGQGERSTGQRLVMSFLYVFGMILSFSALGLVAAFSGRLFGSALQSSASQFVIAGIFVILALSSFGLFELRLPNGLMGKAMNASNSQGYIGGLLAGLLAGVLASPCIGPFILALIVFVAEKGSLFTGIWMFALLGLGMGIPYLILGMAAGSVQKLPKSGNWMIGVKKLLGIVLLALANYYLRGFTGEKAFYIILGLLILSAGVYVNPLRKFNAISVPMRMLIRLLAIALLASGAFYISRAFVTKAELHWQSYTDALLTQAKESQQPVLIDFESKIWCASCREMEEKTYSRPEVQKALQSYMLLKVDVDKHPESEALAARFGVHGIPDVVVLNDAGVEVGRIVGYVPWDAFLERLKKMLKPVI